MVDQAFKKDGSKYFVATTALEGFWDTSLPIVFMGEWCKRYSRKSYWEAIDHTTLSSGIKEEEVLEVIKYLQEVYESLLPVLAKNLNDIHGVKFSVRYWRIVLGPWLLFYIHTMHDKYSQISSLKQSYPDHTTRCLDESCFVTPDDTLTFANLMTGDFYNLQLYSQVFKILGYKFPAQEMIITSGPGPNMDILVKPKTMINKFIWQSIDLIDRVLLNRKRIVFEGVYFPKSALRKLMFKMKFKFWPYVGKYERPDDLAADPDARTKLAGIQFGESEFERMLMPMIATGLPKNMLEGFFVNRAKISRKCNHPPRAIISAVGWYFNEEFKMYAAQCAESGSTLLGVQHGGGYGMLAYLLMEEYELSITDRFFSWGWMRNNCHAKIEPVSATKLVNKGHRRTDHESKDILYVTDTCSRFMLHYPIRADFWKDYLDQQSVFLSNLSTDIKKRLVIRPRPHSDDLGMDYQARFKDIVPDIRIEIWGQPFSDRGYDLLICDHPCYSTTFIESLANNKPTILFINPQFAANYFNELARPYWNKLQEIGILFKDPKEASKKIGEIHDHVNDWWYEPQRQEGVKSFISEFGRVSDQWDKEWVEVLESELV